MSLTVVTVRDENGAPSTLESYAGASRYRIGDGNLEIMSPDKQILGLYDSGNWLSVYAGDSVKVISVGAVLDFSPPGDTDTSSPGDTDSSSLGETDTSAPGETDTSAPGDTDSSSPGDTETDPVELGSAADPEVDASSIEPVDTSPTEPDVKENVGAASIADEPKAPRPAPRPAADPPVSERAIEFVTPPERPSWLRPVVIRPRALRAPRSAGTQPPTPAASRMMRVVVRPRARPASAQAEPPTRDAAQPDGSEPK
jgi:hypothetical protein